MPNRLALHEDLKARMRDFPDEKDGIDICRFKQYYICKRYHGASFGDLLIAEIGKRLYLMFDKQHSVYRRGGDEFIILCCGFESLNNMAACAERILQSFSHSLEIKSSTLYTTVSIGISIYPDDGTDPDGLMQSADIVIYRDKASGKNKYVY